MQLVSTIRNDWTKEELESIYYLPLLQLISEAMEVHKNFHKVGEVQASSLVSIKTGGCSEDCAYCPQSAKYNTGLKPEKLMEVEDVVASARKAKENGSNRFCMGASWRELRNNKDFPKVLNMVRQVSALGMEVCCSLGMLDVPQARALKEAGLTVYNHNLDTSEDYYPAIISTRTYQDRLRTLKNVRDAGLSVCTGGILGMGESEEDRIKMIKVMANLPKHPESVTINILMPIQGTPLEDVPQVSVWEVIRAAATVRISMPESKIRLSAGRNQLSLSEQALCFLAGVNAVFLGEKLLTAGNVTREKDEEMFSLLGISLSK
ncbi:MAG: biotin synthase BioB [Cytophagaceae bacterium]